MVTPKQNHATHIFDLPKVKNCKASIEGFLAYLLSDGALSTCKNKDKIKEKYSKLFTNVLAELDKENDSLQKEISSIFENLTGPSKDNLSEFMWNLQTGVYKKEFPLVNRLYLVLANRKNFPTRLSTGEKKHLRLLYRAFVLSEFVNYI